MQKWRLRADRTLVCVDNRREYTLRVELMRDGTRHKVAQLNMRPFQEKCDWFPIVEGSLLNARIDWVGAVRDAYPPQWQGILNTGETLRLHVGVDGATPFAHSSVL